tara:strand:- start:599 stop:823 length:225 start_codon:yes stop_codon:yes gene_type:complete
MHIGDLVVPKTRHEAPMPRFDPLERWLGLVLALDTDGDPTIQWFDSGKVLGDPIPEFQSAVKVLQSVNYTPVAQ